MASHTVFVTDMYEVRGLRSNNSKTCANDTRFRFWNTRVKELGTK